jgi:hypothetical protein
MVIIAMLLVLMSNLVLALGVGPSREYIDFSPGEKIGKKLLIINDGHQAFKAAVYPQSSLAEYVTIKTPLIEVASTDATKQVEYEISFPEEPPKPGEHKIELVVRPFPADTKGSEGTTIAANIALISQLIVRVPYPGMYADGKLYISGAESPDTPATFEIAVYNFGTEDIQDAYAKVEIFGPTWEKLADFYTDNRSIKSKDEAKLRASWKPDVNKGTYTAVATVNYGDKQFKLQQNFDVGTFMIDVSDISVNKFRLGDVAKFDITLLNSWNTEMEGVYVEMTVEDSAGNVMTDFKTSTVDILPNQEGKLEAYWYTEGVAPGIYKVKLIVNYAGKVTQKEYDFEVSTNSITNLGLVGHAVTEEEVKDVTTQGVLILLVIIVLVLLIGMNIAWFYFLSKKIKGKGGEK